MKKIVHLSDLHFGTVEERTADLVAQTVNDLQPDVVAVSGDLTQRARSREFIAAKRFLDRLPKPQIVVPGNHDIPMYNILDRFFKKLEKFQKHITADLMPTYIDAEVAVIGLNSARSNVIKGGRINKTQIDYVQAQLCHLHDDMLKVVVTHHPFDVPPGRDRDLIGRAEMAMPKLSECGGDVFLSGHLHVENVETTAKRYKLDNGRTALVIQAGTAMSSRLRGEPHSFNFLEFDQARLSVHRMDLEPSGEKFVVAETKIYQQAKEGWTKVS